MSDDAVESVAEYRAVAPLALIALALGLLSPVALAAPFLLIIPAAAVGAALLALAGIAKAEGRQSGGGLARAAIVLALVSAGAAVVRGPVRARLVQRQLDAAAQEWVDALAAEDFEGALARLTPRRMYRFLPERRPGSPQPPQDEVIAQALASLPTESVARYLSGVDAPRAKPIGPVADPADDRGSTRATVQYALPGGDGDASEPTVVLSFLRNEPFEQAGFAWRIDSWAFDSGGSE